MTTEIHANYVITKKLDLDLVAMESSCHQLYALVVDRFREHPRLYVGQGVTPSAELLLAYNAFMYPYDQFHELFHEVKTAFREHCHDTKTYYMHCWLNCYQAGTFSGWHGHWSPEQQTWHGFYCVHTEPSRTSYKIPGLDEPIDIACADNLLVLARSNGDLHRTYPWHDEKRPRVTLAFDIIPKEHLDPAEWLNHWIPI